MPNATLFIVSTPIGHLGDISYRAIDTLKRVAFILCEDTRVSQKLLKHYGITTPLRAFHDFTTAEQLHKILADMQGLEVALISDAGTPLLQDPGFELVLAARDAGITVTAIPGASSITNAVVLSGLAPYPYSFFGFIPTKLKAKQEFIMKILATPHTLVCFESMKRIKSTLEVIQSLAPTRQIRVLREMTKQFETVYHGTANDLLAQEILEKGEAAMVIGPASEEIKDPLAIVDRLVQQGMKPVDAIKEVAKSTSLTKSQLYEQYISR